MREQIKIKYLILGAGPAGLSFANKLVDKGETSFLVLEKEQEAGGLCRSLTVDNAPLDIGGGHFLDTKDTEVDDYLFKFLDKNEWNLFYRDSRIQMNNYEINHPFEANIWQMPIEQQAEYLESIAKAGCNNEVKMPEMFIDWIEWKLGKKIAYNYMIPYNQKMFGKDLDILGTYWMNKLPNVSFRETIRSCLEKKAYGTQPGHSVFLYPKKYGYGEVWLRMAERLGEKILYGKTVKSLDIINKKIICEDSNIFHADYIIVTIPWLEFSDFIGATNGIVKNINKLKYNSIQVEYISDNINTKAHWLYYPQKEISYHRILVRKNFASKASGYWTETNIDRIDKVKNSNYKYINKYAYPLNTVDKPVIMKELLTFMEKYQIYGLGRWGEHQHYNSDVAVRKAFELCERVIDGKVL